MPRLNDLKFFCGYCNENHNRDTFYRHKRKYYRASTNSWLPSEATSGTAKRRKFQNDSGPAQVFDDHFLSFNNDDVPSFKAQTEEEGEDDAVDSPDYSSDSSTEDSPEENDVDSDLDDANPEVWDNIQIGDLLQDVGSATPCPEPGSNQRPLQKVTSLVQWLVYFLLLWQSVCKISDNGLEWLLKFLYTFLESLAATCGNRFLAELVIAFPSSLYLLRKAVTFDRDSFKKYVVCPKCCKLYLMTECTERDRRGTIVVRHCQAKKYKKDKPCGAPLSKKVLLSDKKEVFYPHKVYCYNSVIDKLEEMVQRKGFPESCESWRKVQRPEGYLADVSDGKVWKEFENINGKDFLNQERNYLFMLNFDFFQPKKHRNDYSVGVLYLANLNLVRSLRFKWENIIIVGIIPGLDKEPGLNNFLMPLVDEMRALWKGLYFKSSACSIPLVFRAAIACIACDIPAARKICGFKSHNSHHGCSRCFKKFPGNVRETFDFSGFDRENWPARDMRTHRRHADKLRKARNKSHHDKMAKEFGLFYSTLLELEYFDAIRFTVVDPMHNLFLGTAKSMFKLWVKEDILKKQNLKEIENRIRDFDVGTGLGRLPHKISANYGCYTASQWKNWTLVYSLYVLDGILPPEHMQCWQAFVLACKFMTRPVMTTLEVQKADHFIMKFCMDFQKLYGPSAVKPNMHLHGHLKDCILDYGPVYNFWCFSFERYNGILTTMKTNNRCIEIQLMRKLLSEQFSISAVLPEEFEGNFSHLFSKHTASDAAQTVDFLELGPNVMMAASERNLRAVHWNNVNVTLPNFYKIKSLDTDDLSCLLDVYKAMYGESVVVMENLGKTARRFGSVHIGPEKFGSRMECRTLRSARVYASWVDTTGTINGQSALRPGRVNAYIQHQVKLQSTLQPHVFALVDWYEIHEDGERYRKPLELWKSTFLPGGNTSFLPVDRIYCKFVVACKQDDCLVIVPLNRTFT